MIWEVTRACELACRHCRAEAIPSRDLGELATSEGVALVRDVAAFGTPPPLLVLTGGDPFLHPDLDELVRAAADLGLHVSVSPSGTPSVTRERLASLRAAGAASLSLSIDGSTPAVHDGFRGVAGVFGWTLAAARTARELGFRLQVNTTATPHDVWDLPAILALVRQLGAATWSVFFLVPTGRGAELPQLPPRAFEDVLNFLYDAERAVSVKVTEAPHFRRVVAERLVLERRGIDPASILRLGETYRRLRELSTAALPDVDLDAPGPLRRPPLDVDPGRGFVFVSHTGDVQPSGFLPISAGNVRRRSLADIYRRSPLFEALRDRDRLSGRCGRCEYRRVCGGSRSRAFGITGDPLASEPWCSYEPGTFPYAAEAAELLGIT